MAATSHTTYVLTITAVKTLAIRQTSEEVMVHRSKALKENKQEFTKEMTEDRTIRDFIEVRNNLLSKLIIRTS